ncbi:MAG: hypothetical protein M0R22_13330 [Dehalococcoidia bacterium]|jgi:hypothetical protein|nr:hypothetical protein [Dehalococcoidia bacterium]
MARLTDFGFTFGVAAIERLFHDKRSHCVGIKTPRCELQVHITPTGLVRIFDYKGNEWKPTKRHS